MPPRWKPLGLLPRAVQRRAGAVCVRLAGWQGVAAAGAAPAPCRSNAVICPGQKLVLARLSPGARRRVYRPALHQWMCGPRGKGEGGAGGTRCAAHGPTSPGPHPPCHRTPLAGCAALSPPRTCTLAHIRRRYGWGIKRRGAPPPAPGCRRQRAAVGVAHRVFRRVT